MRVVEVIQVEQAISLHFIYKDRLEIMDRYMQYIVCCAFRSLQRDFSGQYSEPEIVVNI